MRNKRESLEHSQSKKKIDRKKSDLGFEEGIELEARYLLEFYFTEPAKKLA